MDTDKELRTYQEMNQELVTETQNLVYIGVSKCINNLLCDLLMQVFFIMIYAYQINPSTYGAAVHYHSAGCKRNF